MGLRDILKKKDDINAHEDQQQQQQHQNTNIPELRLMRTDTVPQDVAEPSAANANQSHLAAKEPNKARRSLDFFRPRSRSRSASASSQVSNSEKHAHRDSAGRRLSQRLHLGGREHDTSDSVPEDLPEIRTPLGDVDETEWERRATMLAGQNELARSRPQTPSDSGRTRRKSSVTPGRSDEPQAQQQRSSPRSRPQTSQEIDADIQEAIRLHEAGDLAQSTSMFGRLADPNGANNPLSQVLYGLALRHGWGCTPDQAGAVRHLTAAASNAASVEQLALQAGMTKGGAAKGELVLAIFELANCFRHGWGIEKDAVAAQRYYETAANLGDTDAMNEIAWCYLEGYGCKKDKFKAAQYYRLAENAGNKTLGNSWIWKDKYNPEIAPKK
ncbi:Protein DSF2 [Emericellopsis cladophorae]|uniref:Protein DSF2 n=1 Tax=Emericellopsis cladophorae TaxID=2686198 RepID=A0A9Q0BH97_9HYPO|nr:Protein DSF2 [Emericellopsis cladophorae]KAI6785837.1 Protein DSF2 [Emericellopsis cladophorae]